MSRRLRAAALLLLTLLLSSLWLPAVYSREPAAAPTTVPDLERQYQADQSSLRGALALPASEAYLDRQQRLGEEWRARLEKFDFASLDPREQAEYLLLRSEVQGLLDETAQAKQRLAEIAPLLPFRTTIHELETARRHWGASDCQAAASKVAELARAVKQVREHLPKAGGKPVSAAVALRAAETLHELQEVLKRWYSFYDGYLPEFAWWLKKPQEDAAKELDKYAKHLRKEVAGLKGEDDDPLVGEPIGAESLAAGIRREWLPYTADELIAIGQREFAWCEGEMKKAAREMKLGDDWKAALARVKADYVPPGQQDELAADRPRGHRLRQAARPGHRAAAMRGIVGSDDDLAGGAENGSLCGLQRPADDGRVCQRRHGPGRQAHGDAGQQPPLHAPGHSARADSRAPPARLLRSARHEAAFLHALLRGRLGLVLGMPAVGPRLAQTPRIASACCSGG